MKAGKDLLLSFLTRFLVFLLHDLGVVLYDVRKAAWREEPLPEVVGLNAVWIRRVACAVVPALVEGKEPGRFAGQLGAHLNLLVVHGEMHHTAPELEKRFARVAVAAILLDGVIDGLLGEAVFQLERRQRETVDEQAE